MFRIDVNLQHTHFLSRQAATGLRDTSNALCSLRNAMLTAILHNATLPASTLPAKHRVSTHLG